MNGRMGRLEYFVKCFLLNASIFGVQLAITLAFLGSDFSQVIALLAGVGGAALGLILAVKRLHDIERPGWHLVLVLVPIYNLFLLLCMLFKKGTDGENLYGSDPIVTPA